MLGRKRLDTDSEVIHTAIYFIVGIMHVPTLTLYVPLALFFDIRLYKPAISRAIVIHGNLKSIQRNMTTPQDYSLRCQICFNIERIVGK